MTVPCRLSRAPQRLKRGHKKRKEYLKMERAYLEREANMLLYGQPKVPKRSEGIQYLAPKTPQPSKYKNALCSGCRKPVARDGAGLCRACYRNKAKKKRIGSGKETVSAEEFDRLTAVGYEGAGEGKVFRLMGVIQPDQIEVTYRSQIATAHQTFHAHGVLISFEETEEVLDQLSRVA